MPFDGSPPLTIEDLTASHFNRWLQTGKFFVGFADNAETCPLANWVHYELGGKVEASTDFLHVNDQSFTYPNWMRLFIKSIDNKRWTGRRVSSWRARRNLNKVTKQLGQHPPLAYKERINAVR